MVHATRNDMSRFPIKKLFLKRTVITTSIEVDASLEMELSIRAPVLLMAQDKQTKTSNNKGNFMKNVKGGIAALLEQLVQITSERVAN